MFDFIKKWWSRSAHESVIEKTHMNDLSQFVNKSTPLKVLGTLSHFSHEAKPVLQGQYKLASIESSIECDMFNYSLYLHYLKGKITSERFEELRQYFAEDLLDKLERGGRIDKAIHVQLSMINNRREEYLKTKMDYYAIEISNILHQKLYTPKYTYVSFYITPLMRGEAIMKTANNFSEKNLTNFSIVLAKYVEFMLKTCVKFGNYIKSA